MLLAWETLSIFLLTGISNNIFFLKKKNVVVYSNIQDTFAFTNLTYNLTLRLRMISSLVVLAPHGEGAKALPVVRLATHKFHVSVDAVVQVELLDTTFADKHMATVLPNFVLVRCWQRLESLVTDITVVNTLSLLCFVPPH